MGYFFYVGNKIGNYIPILIGSDGNNNYYRYMKNPNKYCNISNEQTIESFSEWDCNLQNSKLTNSGYILNIGNNISFS